MKRGFCTVIRLLMHHAKSKEKVYSEIFRVLKPGGRFVISDAVTKYPLPYEIRNVDDARAHCFGGAVTEKEYLDSIVSSGFKNIDILKRREYKKNGYDFTMLFQIIKGCGRMPPPYALNRFPRI